MAIILTKQLIGPLLDWAVATSEELPIKHDPMGFTTGLQSGYWVWPEEYPVKSPGYQLIGENYSPSTIWLQAGPIIEREKICLTVEHSSIWVAYSEQNWLEEKRFMQTGLSPLVAAMRCYVAIKLGHEIEIPNGLSV